MEIGHADATIIKNIITGTSIETYVSVNIPHDSAPFNYVPSSFISKSQYITCLTDGITHLIHETIPAIPVDVILIHANYMSWTKHEILKQLPDHKALFMDGYYWPNNLGESCNFFATGVNHLIDFHENFRIIPERDGCFVGYISLITKD